MTGTAMSVEHSAVKSGQPSSLLEVRGLSVSFEKPRSLSDILHRRARSRVRAVNDVTFEMPAHETLGLVGESGSGKTTLGRALLRLTPVERGEILFEGNRLDQLGRQDLRRLRRRMQVVFQDPYSSLNPRFTVAQTLAEVLRVHRLRPADEIPGRVAELMTLVGLPSDMADRRPSSLSGGQRQRVGLARALAMEPSFLVLDEPVAALDVSIQAQVLNLLKDLRDRLDLTMLFIAHELAVVQHMSDRVAVMYLGQIVEIGRTEEIFAHPGHPYTRSLLKAVPRLVPERRHRQPVLTGEVPSPLNIPSGCPFHPRCPRAEDRCRKVAPPVVALSETQHSRCHFAEPSQVPNAVENQRGGSYV